MDVRSPFLEALWGHESHRDFEGRVLQSWDNLLRVPGRKGTSGVTFWSLMVGDAEVLWCQAGRCSPVCGMDGVQMFGMSQQKCGKVKSQENSASGLEGSRLTPSWR